MSSQTKKSLSPFGILVFVFSFLLILGGTLAYMFARSDPAENHFSEAVVSCSVSECFDGTAKTSITVTNTGNIPAYLRVRLVSYWVNESNEIIGKPAQVPGFIPGEGWIDLGDQTYCFCEAIAPNAAAPDLLSEGTSMILAQEDGCFQVVEIFADAIQGAPAEAVTESWGVTVNSQGIITD